jgi:hypothetical protein
MIRIWMVQAMLSVLAFPAAAETSRVLSGEHGDFTRLVIEQPEADDWTLGRTETGYAFGQAAGIDVAYDLSRVWQRIARTRLKSVQLDPKTGLLELDLACDCHVFPFEYQPGIIVLDIKPGPAPPGSVFEAGLAPRAAEGALTGGLSAAGSYDWLGLARDPAGPVARTTLPLVLDTVAVSLEPLRDELLEQISRGAVEGVVDMELPGKPPKVAETDNGELPWSQIRIGEQPGLEVIGAYADKPETGEPADCPAEGLLDVAAWGEDRPALDLLAEARNGLYGELDIIQPDALLRSVQLHIYLGFGAEAAQQATLLQGQADDSELLLYASMARIVDQDSDPQTPFVTMLGCNGPAALWAALARDRLPPGPELNRKAVLGAFLALPTHLRRHLGAGLAEKFLAHGDAEAARIIRDTLERTPGADQVEVALLDAESSMHDGDIESAQAHADHALSLDADREAGLVALVETHFRTIDPLEPDVAEALLAQRGEGSAGPTGDELDRAIVLALALSGQTDNAFADKAASGAVLSDLWQVAHSRATDDDFLRHAVLDASTNRPETAPEVAFAIAERLVALGFHDAALVWLGPVDPADDEAHRLMAAEAELGRGNAREAVVLVEGLHDARAEELRAKALVQLGDLALAGKALMAAGDVEGSERLGLWDRNWAAASPTTQEPWFNAADHAETAAPEGEGGLLGRGNQSLEKGLAARTAVETLLSAVPSPASN